MSYFLSKIIHKFFGRKIGFFYDNHWNPINYALIGGVGVLINMLILLPLSTILPLWLANIFAIFCAWSWNWANSVGPLGYFWGFNNRQTKRK